MFLTRFFIVSFSLFGLPSWLASLHAADWPRWGGRDDSNMVSEEKGLPESFVPGKKRSDGSGIDLRRRRT